MPLEVKWPESGLKVEVNEIAVLPVGWEWAPGERGPVCGVSLGRFGRVRGRAYRALW